MNRKPKSSQQLLTALMFVALLGLGIQGPQVQASENQEIPSNLNINMKQAMDIAKQTGGGKVLEIELEKEYGQWVYEAKLQMPNGWEKEIHINARNGKVIKVEIESNEYE
ncbi:MAG: PepSY domain-containing protein [Candidatus Nitronauta litoralis]|uniref:PepSY domain-containing protein n=1 Tax=Candidatus Nitronauta litoralis TaxID=2705533 RepID=A0A7T0BYR5_9BACT|nr:MAG: PepSY domain-containing protein [Candidatus Nitronauta litoralis]